MPLKKTSLPTEPRKSRKIVARDIVPTVPGYPVIAPKRVRKISSRRGERFTLARTALRLHQARLDLAHREK